MSQIDKEMTLLIGTLGDYRRYDSTTAYSRIITMTTQQQIDAILDDPATSFWLHNAFDAAFKRDPVDAWADADMLAKLLKARLDEMQSC